MWVVFQTSLNAVEVCLNLFEFGACEEVTSFDSFPIIDQYAYLN